MRSQDAFSYNTRNFTRSLMVGKIISHFKIVEQLGKGGMGIVYKAKDTLLDRFVALKIISEHFLSGTNAKARFHREAKAVAKLNHPNIAQVYEFGQTEHGQYFIAFEYLEGHLLKQVIEENSFSFKERIDIMIQIAEGLKVAHDHRIVHRDLKPGNIMIQPDGTVKILDFGLAKVEGDSQLTKDGITLGTVQYMSPEQVQSASVDRRSDIFSFGTILYELITSRQPFQSEYEQAVLYSILNEDPESVTSIRTEVPIELERVLNKAMAKNPSERYQHIEDLIVDLKKVKKELNSDKIATLSLVTGISKYRKTSLIGSIIILLIIVGVISFDLFPTYKQTVDSIGVLPLKNISGDSTMDYFSIGMTEQLITELGKISALTVIQPKSVMHYKDLDKSFSEIGRELKVDALINASFFISGNRIRVNASLVSASNNEHLWGNSFHRNLNDYLDLHREIAQEISEQIQINLTPRERQNIEKQAESVDPEVLTIYNKGRYRLLDFSKESFMAAYSFFQKAIELDSTYAPAYASLAELCPYYPLFNLDVTTETCKNWAVKAVSLDDNLAEAHVALGWTKYVEWDWIVSESEFQKAIRINPNSVSAHQYYSQLLRTLSRNKESLKEIRRAEELDPFNLTVKTMVSWPLFNMKHYEEALFQLEEVLQMNPDYGLAHYTKGLIYLLMDEPEKVLKSANQAAQYLGDTFHVYLLKAGAHVLAGREKQTLILIEKIKEYQNYPEALAIIYMLMGREEETLKWLDKGYQQHHFHFPSSTSGPFFDDLRDHPRFIELRKKMGLR